MAVSLSSAAKARPRKGSGDPGWLWQSAENLTGQKGKAGGSYRGTEEETGRRGGGMPARWCGVCSVLLPELREDAEHELTRFATLQTLGTALKNFVRSSNLVSIKVFL